MTQKLNKCVAVLVASSATSATFVFESPAPGFVWTGTLNCAGAPYNAIFTATIGNVSWGNWAGNSVYGPVQAEGGEQLIVTMTLPSAIGVATSLEMCWLGSVDEVGMVAPIWPDANSSSQQTQLVGAINANITGGSLTSVGSITSPVGISGAVTTNAGGSTVINAPTTSSTPGPTGLVTNPWYTITGTGNPAAICCDSSGNVFTANTTSNTITKVTPGGVATNSWASTGVFPGAICADPSGNIFTANQTSNTITKVTPGGVATAAWATLASSPTGIAADSAGNIYTCNLNNTISKVTAGGVLTAAWVTLPGGANPFDIAIDSSNNLYVANASSNTISKITSGGVLTAAWATLPGGSQPENLCVDSSGNVYVANQIGNTISKITSGGVLTAAWATLPGAQPYGIVTDSSGNVYCQTGSTNSIVKVTPSGTLTTGWASTTGGSLLALDSITGSLYVNNYAGQTIIRAQSNITGSATSVPVSSTAGFAASGLISVPASGGTLVYSYTATTGTAFTGCVLISGGNSWYFLAGTTITQAYNGLSPTIPVTSTSSFPSAGLIALQGSLGTVAMNYTGTTGTAFTGCTLANGQSSWYVLSKTAVVIPVSTTGQITTQPNAPGTDTLLSTNNGFISLPSSPFGVLGTVLSSSYTGFLVEVTSLGANSVISVTLSNNGQNGSSGYNATQTITRNMTTSSLGQFYFSIPATVGDLITLTITGSVSTSGQVAVIAYRSSPYVMLENNPLHTFETAILGGGSYVNQLVTTSSVLVVGMGALAAGLSYRLHSWSVDTIPTAGKVELWDNSTTGRVFGIFAATNTQTTQFLGGVLTPGPVYVTGPSLTPATVRACIFYDIVQTPVIA